MVHRRRLRITLLGLSTALWASSALAQTGGTSGTGTGSLATSDFLVKMRAPSSDGKSWIDLATTDAALYLNQARCQCQSKVRFFVDASGARTKLATSPPLAAGAYARFYVGSSCAQLNANLDPACPKGFLGQTDLSSLIANDWSLDVTVDKLFTDVGITCAGQLGTTIWLWVNSTGTSSPDSNVTPSLGIALDGTPPPAPAGIAVEDGNEALIVSWDPKATTNPPDLAGYLVFCARGEDLVVFNPGFYSQDSPQYLSGQTLCPNSALTPQSIGSTSSVASTDNKATEIGSPTFFQTPRTEYLCSDRLSPTDVNTRIRILENGISYKVGVAAVDKSGNISPISSAFVQRPGPTIDFYRAYRDAGGQSPGGYCSVGNGISHPGALVLLAGTGLVGLFILRRRRNRRRHTIGGMILLLGLLSASPTQAQAISRERDKQDFDQPVSFRTPRHWAFELRFGPFRPNVDSEFSGTGATPYKTTFGGSRHLMSQLEIDWQVFQSFGSLSVGAVVGYYSTSAKAFKADPTTGASTGKPSGDMTSLRLIPTAALLVYRMDLAAEQWKIPLVPYAKVGLNYTFWNIKDGNGRVPSYLGGRGSGGTAGWQAAAGLSLQLDFLDPSAARNLDIETGINHSYLFFEWNHVEATGLGQKDKLNLGDSRWVIGMMCEF